MSNVKTGLTAQGKHLQFSRVAFGYHGNWFVAGDHHGNIYHFDLTKNRSVRANFNLFNESPFCGTLGAGDRWG